VSGTTYTPVGILKPIMIDGSEVKRASLCNPGIMRGLGLKIGSTVSVIKAKKIIPKIISIVELGDGEEVNIPAECVNCGEELICNETKLFCPNKECSNKLLHQLKKWINTLNILEFGERLIELVFENGMVEELADLYTLQVEDLAELISNGKKVGMKNSQKAMDNLLAKTEITLPVFIAGFDIPSVGEKLIDLLVAAEYDTLEKLQKAEVDELTLVKGVGDKKAVALKDGLILHKKAMKHMLQHVTIVKPTVNEKTDVSVCFTGTLSRPRKELEALVKSSGGTVKKTVVNGLSYLVTDSPESGSKKNQDAQKKGVQVIDEAEFIRLFR
jgi:DNA ligase (NAD+)